MKLASTLNASTSRFAHLIGLGRKPAAVAAADDDEHEDEHDDEARAESDDEDEQDGEGDGDKGKKGKKSKRAKKADDDSEGDGDGEGDEARAESDDEDEEEDKGDAKKAHAKGRRLERARCAKIFSHAAASRNIALACSLAFETNMQANAVIAILEAQPASRAPLSARMHESGAASVRVAPSMPEQPKGKAALAASWDRVTAQFAQKKTAA